jgi:aspartyl-tRNA(Asn)/glutamyl-tRNA(Gln) amidotransferase subunit B
MKTDANVSIKYGDKQGQRIEIKNITGTNDIERALKYEILRQTSMAKRGVEVVQETRMWNPDLGTTMQMRTKETEEEYGYIFEPDLTMIEIKREMSDKAKKSLPELPDQRYARFIKEYGLPAKVAESIVSEKELADLFEEIAGKVDARLAGTWISGYLKKTLNWHSLRFREAGLKKEWIVDLLNIFEKGKITDRNAEMAVRFMIEEGKGPDEVVKKHGLGKGSVDIDYAVKKVLGSNRKAVSDLGRGEEKALHFLVGQCMRETHGKADAEDIRKAIKKALK